MGIYEDGTLIQKLQSKQKTSEVLPIIFDNILKNYKCKNLYYAKGPGSFMAIKITYLFLKTLSISQNMQLFATDGFTFNQNNPIKAISTLYFIKKDGKITTQKIDDINYTKVSFNLPDNLDISLFNSECEPLYILPAV